MTTYSRDLTLSTEGHGEAVDLTGRVEAVVAASGIQQGSVSVFVPGSTAAITAMEYERGGIHDLKQALDRLVPPEGDYEHNRLNHDTNSHAHIRAAIVGPSETFPVDEGRVRLGIWQQIVLLDFDDRPRERTVIVTVS